MSYSHKTRLGLLVTLLIVAGSGCAVFRKDLGPIHKIPRKYRVAQGHEVEVSLKCRDRRPEWERHYQRPVIDPRLERWSAELLTADNFSPNPITQFKRHVSARLTKLDPAPVSAEIVVKRFHVIVKYAVSGSAEKVTKPIPVKLDEEHETTSSDLFAESRYNDARAKWATADRTARAKGEKSPPEPQYHDFNAEDESDDPFDELETQVSTAIVKFVIFDLPVAMATSVYDATKLYAYRGQPPEWAAVPPGVTCEIDAQIHLRWADGRQTMIPLTVKESEKYAISPDGRNSEVAPFLAEVVVKSADKVAQQASDFLEPSTDNAAAIDVDP